MVEYRKDRFVFFVKLEIETVEFYCLGDMWIENLCRFKETRRYILKRLIELIKEKLTPENYKLFTLFSKTLQSTTFTI